MQPSVFDFNDPVDFLQASLTQTQKQNPQFSLRAWSRQLGQAQPALLSMVLNRKRKLLPSLGVKLGESFKKRSQMSEQELRYFNLLVVYANAGSAEEKLLYQKLLASLRPDQSFSTLQLDQLRAVQEWYHFAVLEMTELTEFSKVSPRNVPKWMSSKLDEVSPSEIKEAIDRLLRLGLLEANTKGQLSKTKSKLATPTDIPNRSIRTFHAEMLRRATIALESQAIDHRDITGHLMPISVNKLPQAKILIRNFRTELAELLKPDSSKQSVYFLGIQLFDLLTGKGSSHEK